MEPLDDTAPIEIESVNLDAFMSEAPDTTTPAAGRPTGRPTRVRLTYEDPAPSTDGQDLVGPAPIAR